MTEIAKQKQERVRIACNHQEPDRVPIFVYPGSAVMDYAGVNWWNVEKNAATYAEMTDRFFGQFDFDLQWHYIGGNPRSHESLYHRTETFLADDGVTMQHLQSQEKMRADEYPALTNDPIGFLKQVLLPRKYPELFAGSLADAAKRVEIAVDEMIWNMILGPNGQVSNYLEEKYGAHRITNLVFGAPAIDVIFDRFRGFSGTLTDLRRQPDAVLAACEALFESPLCEQCKGIQSDAPFGAYLMAHIPTYMNPKQFEKYYWPQLQQIILNLHADGNKFYLLAEGTWKHLWDYFLELPKDSVFIQVDDDDIFEVNKRLGGHQIIGGGMKTNMTKMFSKEVCIDYAKRVIDECAPGGGFIFCNNKCLSCTGDINQTVIDVFNFAAEYGQYK